MSVTVKLPVGDEPDWEIKDVDENDSYLKSTAERYAFVSLKLHRLSPVVICPLSSLQLRSATILTTMLA